MRFSKRTGRTAFKLVVAGLTLWLIAVVFRAPLPESHLREQEDVPVTVDSVAKEQVQTAPMQVRFRHVDLPERSAEDAPARDAQTVVPAEMAQGASEMDEIVPDEAIIAEGVAAVAKMDEGEFPEIAADFRTHVGFTRYAQEMQRIGARFFVMYRGRGEVVWEVRLPDGALSPVTSIAGLSPRSRRISDEPEVRGILAEAQRRSPGSYDLVVLIPTRLEAYIIGSLARAASTSGRDVSEFRRFDGHYRFREERMCLELDRVRLRDGDEEAFQLRIVI